MITEHVKRAGYTLIRIAGRIDNESYTEFGFRLSQQIDDGENHLLLDLSEVSYINSAGLRELVIAARLLREEGGDVILLKPSPRVMEVLDITGLNAIFNVIPEEDDMKRLT